MDVSIAVSLIRGQMGTVVERAVNVAVETVLAEMLKVVGAKFEELKTQVMLMKRDMVALQKEKALKEKENDNIRAKLRYTELKLKYYRQGVEEELQQRASSSTLVRIYPPGYARGQGGEVLPTEPSPSCSAQRTPDTVLVKSGQECTSSQSTCRRASRACCPSDTTCSDSMELRQNAPAEPLDGNAAFLPERDICPTRGPDEAEWSISVGSHSDATVATPSIQILTTDTGPPPAGISSSPPAHSWSPPSPAPQVKQELHPQEEEEEEVICIKEEPEEQQVMATLEQQSCPPESEAQLLVTERNKPSTSQMNPSVSVSSGGPNTYATSQLAASLPPGALQPWSKDLTFYDEFKLRRNELRRRNLSRQRELEKELPQPLLANLVQERREKTRLRVARWRAKRKLQAYLNQTQAQAGAAGSSPSGFAGGSQQLTAPCASRNQQRQNASSFLCSAATGNMPVILPLISASSSPLILQCPSMLPNDQNVTSSSSSSSSSSCTQVSLSQTQMFNSES